MIGADIRMGRLRQKGSGRSLILAMDHGLLLGAIPGLEDPLATLDKLVALDPEGIVLSTGTLARGADRFAVRGAPAAIARIDIVPLDPRLSGNVDEHRVFSSVEHAAAIGADAVIMFVVANARTDILMRNLATVGAATEAAHRAGLAVISEVISWSLDPDPDGDPIGAMALGCRICSEIGVDAVKTVHPGNSIGELAAQVASPLFILGGSPADGVDILEQSRSAIAAGATGLIYGRQVTQSDDPAKLVGELNKIVHGSDR